MPLPFAPKPDTSRVYDSLKDKLLTEITADNFDSLKGSVYAQGVDGAEDEYRRLLLLGLAADQVSLSGPMPGTSQVREITVTSADTKTPDDFAQTGEVWQCGAFAVSSTSGRGGAMSWDLYVYDGTTYAKKGIIPSQSADLAFFILGAGEGGITDVFIDDNSYLVAEAGGTFTNTKITYTAIRVR